jgi:hypothetical protein
MKDHVNFYENIKEAHIRLRGSVIMYDGEPYHVLAICSHRTDGVFRIYLDPLKSYDPRLRRSMPDYSNFHPEAAELGPYLDKWIEGQGDKCTLLRKKMNSPLFNKFRPFPLGMLNQAGKCYYLERQPQRPSTHQGLTRNMVEEHYITIGQSPKNSRGGLYNVELFSLQVRDCILGLHPTAAEVLKNFKDPTIENEAVGFHRNFAFVRGPIGTCFLAYKDKVIGSVPNGDLSVVKLAEPYAYAKEAVAELGVFDNIVL